MQYLDYILKDKKYLPQEIEFYVDTKNKKEYLSFIDVKSLRKFCNKEKVEIPDSNGFMINGEKKINIIGTLLCDFLNCDFANLKSMHKFVNKYSPVLLSGISNVDIPIDYTQKSLDELLIKMGKQIIEFQQKFIEDVNYIYNFDKNECMSDLTPMQRFYVLMNTTCSKIILRSFNSDKIKLKIEQNIISILRSRSISEEKVIETARNDENIQIIPYRFVSDDLSQILILELRELVYLDNVAIKKCQNCGKYFVPEKRADELYCNNEYEDTRRTCKDIGFFKYKQKVVKNDEVARLYRNTYQQKLLRVRRNPDNEEYKKDFDFFRNEYKEIKDKVISGEMSKDEFKEWILSKK